MLRFASGAFLGRGEQIFVAVIAEAAEAGKHLSPCEELIGAGQRHDGDAKLIRPMKRLFAINKYRFTRFDGNCGSPGSMELFHGSQADRWDIETHVLLRLGNFHQRKAAARTNRRHTGNQRVGPFDRFNP